MPSEIETYIHFNVYDLLSYRTFLLFNTNVEISIVFFSNHVIEWREAHKVLSISYTVRMFVVQKQFYDCLYFLNHDLLI